MGRNEAEKLQREKEKKKEVDGDKCDEEHKQTGSTIATRRHTTDGRQRCPISPPPPHSAAASDSRPPPATPGSSRSALRRSGPGTSTVSMDTAHLERKQRGTHQL